VLNEFDGIGAEVSGECAPDQEGKRNETEKKDGNFAPFVGENRGHAADQPQ
jgi:hypothetical protein